MKKLILILSLIFGMNSFGLSLFSNDQAYYLAEILYSARYDYDHGMKINLKEKDYVRESKSSAACESLNIVKGIEILDLFEQGVENHLANYGDEEFNFDAALESIASELPLQSNVMKCMGPAGEMKFYSLDNEFIVSFKIL
ncbi:hypothetical protein [Bacteriovorax sp. Seq25_V]|uniref:hypothetical protein n=1 Tax=Bacteriovorax sp. Seq25_V TaxID=1201288 RepID=UPI00038A3572|nr:hypothetical protein [Bacteriovorax sp. Seq25_V]EQC46229.1 hypothetical protein M900_1754 [Bacteriovorax sp. Seq25_V]